MTEEMRLREEEQFQKLSHSPNIRELIKDAHSWYPKLFTLTLCFGCKISEMMTFAKMFFFSEEVILKGL